MSPQSIRISILKDTSDDGDGKPAGQYAEELRQAILDVAPPGASVTRVRNHQEDMQLGEAVLIELVGNLLLRAIIEGVGAFLSHRRKVRIQVETPEGSVIASDEMRKELASVFVEMGKRLPPTSLKH